MRKPRNKPAKPVSETPVSPAETPEIPVSPVTTELAPATVAVPEPAAIERSRSERIASERAAIREFYAAIERDRASIPLKSYAAYARKAETLVPHVNLRDVSQRQCRVIVAALLGSGTKLDSADAEFVTVPRVFMLGTERVIVENGCGRDMLASGLATTNGAEPADEKLTVRVAALNRFVTMPKLRELGLIADSAEPASEPVTS